ncbi:MAG: hypothetical protein ABI643_03695 [Candidatus Doudnabacteria bacterium]
MIIAIIGIPIGMFIGCLLSRRKSKEFKLWAKADTERDLLCRKLMELVNDPTMSDRKWAEWLPVCEFVDKNYEQNNHLGIFVFSLADVVRQQIDDDSYLRGAH